MVDWKTGTIFMKGGWLIATSTPIDTAFNMGNFAFVDTKCGLVCTRSTRPATP